MSEVKLLTGVHVAANEQRNNIHVINRCLSKLLSNDKDLLALYETVLGQLQIQPYDLTHKYNENDLVWFLDGADLYVLRCISQDSKYPTIDPETYSFENSGWQNEIEYAHLLKIGADKLLKAEVRNMWLRHSLDDKYHKLGKLSPDIASQDYVERKLLNRNLGLAYPNIGLMISSRKEMHFPYQAFSLAPDTSVVNGICRRYDCGLIEYDIVFKFGMSNAVEDTVRGEKTAISCNNVVLNSFSTVLDNGSNGAYAENRKYFFGQSNDIFNVIATDESKSQSLIGQYLQKNRNDLVNTYFAEIQLPLMFYSLNYNVFISDNTSQTSDKETLNFSPNAITVCDKTLNSFKIICVTYPLASQTEYNTEGYNATSGGLATNSFQCQVVGRWR